MSFTIRPNNLPGYEQKSLALHFEKKQADNVADTQSDTETDSNLVALRVKPHLDQKQDRCFKSSYKLLGSTFFYLSRCPDLPSYLDAWKSWRVQKHWRSQKGGKPKGSIHELYWLKNKDASLLHLSLALKQKAIVLTTTQIHIHICSLHCQLQCQVALMYAPMICCCFQGTVLRNHFEDPMFPPLLGMRYERVQFGVWGGVSNIFSNKSSRKFA